MMPTLLIGSIALPTYPLFLLIAYWVGLWLAARQANKFGIDGDHVYNAGLYGLIAGIVGARLWFVLEHWENYIPNPIQALSLSRSALAPTEGLIIASLVVLIYLQQNKVSLGIFLDAAAYGLCLAIAMANIGAFLGGELLGAITTVPWAVEMSGTVRHPVQLYETTISLVILAVLFLISYQPWASFKFWCFVILYSLGRMGLEIFRASPYLIGDGYLGGQILALLIIIVALAVMARNFKKPLINTNSKSL